ncbi:MAG TPA: DUF6259 domain-containing protein [Hanamia sp.]|nr:DUF6259 domain-containing protein [Hanamia sp.]
MIVFKLKQILLFFIISSFSPLLVYAHNPIKKDKAVIIGNKGIRFSFDVSSGTLLAFTDMTNTSEVLNNQDMASHGSIWEITLEKYSVVKKLNINNARVFHFTKVNDKSLQLEWSDFSILSNPLFKVTVNIKVDDQEPFSDWHISVTGLHDEKLERVTFPKIGGVKDMGSENLAVPAWMGELIKNPRSIKEHANGTEKKYSWNYPGLLSMQFLALYNKETQGLYFAANDTMNYFKQFSLVVDSLNNMSYQMNNYPSFDSILKTYILPYNAIIGIFKGDWLSAAFIYRKWAVKQRWCKESMFKQNNNDLWLNKTALWIWNRGESNNVLVPAENIKKQLHLPVNVLWHWWHGCAYDDGFPDYFPPRQGIESFKNAVAQANREGVNAILYMNSFEWGTSTKSFKEDHASRWAVRDINGNMEPHVFNIFTHHSLTPMCMATSFWRNKYSSLADKAINEYSVGGIYMDQACDSYLCYDKDHGHSVGGGNYWVKGFGSLTGQIRANNTSNNKIVLAGEGCSENWLPFLNVFLTLQVSNERYAGVNGPKTIPLFQAVYHQYGVTFGNYSSLVSPPYDALWPEQYAPKHPEQLLNPKYNEQFLMEQARSFVWGMQPTIANYHDFLSTQRSSEIDYLISLAKLRYKVLKYLLYGEFVRAPHIAISNKIIPISRLSIYAGQGDRVKSFQEKVPLLYASAWKANDGSIGIAIASINNDPSQIKFSFDSNSYGLSKRGKIFMITAKDKRFLTSYENGKIKMNFKLPSVGACFLEITSGS